MSAHIAGVGMTRFGKFPDRALKELATEAVREALDDANLGPKRVGMIAFSNSVAGLTSGQEAIRGEVTLRDTGLQGTPIVNVENACASGSSAVHVAEMAVASGQCDVALAVGAEKLHYEDKRQFRALTSAVDVEREEEIRAALGVDRPGADAQSIFMNVYADMARGFMKQTGATARDFAQVAVKNHDHAEIGRAHV